MEEDKQIEQFIPDDSDEERLIQERIQKYFNNNHKTQQQQTKAKEPLTQQELEEKAVLSFCHSFHFISGYIYFSLKIVAKKTPKERKRAFGKTRESIKTARIIYYIRIGLSYYCNSRRAACSFSAKGDVKTSYRWFPALLPVHIYSTLTDFICLFLLKGTPCLKMYLDDNKAFKGEVLVTYVSPISAQLAVTLLNGSTYCPDGVLRPDLPKLSVSMV